MTASTEVWRHRSINALAMIYGLAGILHLVLPQPFLSITPEWVPYPDTVISLTGLCEIAGAIGLWVSRLRRAAGMGLALYAICVFPANMEHAITSLGAADPPIWQWIYHLCRLPLQPLIVWAALFAASIVTWPTSSADVTRHEAN